MLKSKLLVVTVWYWASSVSVTWSLLEMHNLRAHPGSRIKICFSTGSPDDLNASVGKAKLFLCRIDIPVTAAHFLYGEPHGSWPPSAPHSVYEKSARVLGILVGGSFQPITGQLVQLLAAIIGHHFSPDASGICKQVFIPFLQGGRFSPRSTYFLSFCIILFLREWKSFELSVFLKWTATAFLKAECICHSAARNCSKSWPGTIIQQSAIIFHKESF